VAAGVVLGEGEVLERWGSWPDRVEGLKAFRRAAPGLSEDRLPEGIRELLREPGDGTFGVGGELGPVVLPVRWSGSGGTLYARVPARVLSLAGVRRETRSSLVVDRASVWRAARMRGVLLRGPSSAYLGDDPTSGRDELERQAGELLPGGAVVRLRADSAVWWSGWTSGTVRRP
jgi:hypothetical protein